MYYLLIYMIYIRETSIAGYNGTMQFTSLSTIKGGLPMKLLNIPLKYNTRFSILLHIPFKHE